MSEAGSAARTCPAVDIVGVTRRPEPSEGAWASSAAPLADRLAAVLEDLEPLAVHEVEDDPLHWRVFFRSPDARDRALATLAAASSREALTCSAVDVPDEDWAARSQAALSAVRIGDIVVAPPWDVPQADGRPGATDIVLVIKPSTGFGTGHHESTRLCLGLLQARGARGRRVIDVGTGSGVLALAAARLGATAVVAIDDDADAIEAARDNAKLNGLEQAVGFEVSDLRAFAPSEPADLLLANLTGGLLVNVAGQLSALVRPGGTIIVGGFERREADAVIAAFAPDARAVTRPFENGWEAVGLLRQS
jgi:ribosomal protein L11 methyltransferase